MNTDGLVMLVLDLRIRQYRSDYNNRPSDVISFMTAIHSTSERLHSEFVCLLLLQSHRETDRFLQLQGFSLRNLPGSGSTTTVWCSHPSHSQTSRLLTSSLFLGVPDKCSPVSLLFMSPTSVLSLNSPSMSMTQTRHLSELQESDTEPFDP